MTRTEVEIIAEVLRQKVVKIRKMFRPPDAHVRDVEQFAKIQILTLAHDIGIALAKQDPTFDELSVETVRAEVNRAAGQLLDRCSDDVVSPAFSSLVWAFSTKTISVSLNP